VVTPATVLVALASGTLAALGVWLLHRRRRPPPPSRWASMLSTHPGASVLDAGMAGDHRPGQMG
jgi:hypothetical protein